MPMFEDSLDPVLGDERSQSPPPPPQPAERAATPSKPIAIPASTSPASRLSRKLSEESIRTDLCEGPVPDSPLPSVPTSTVGSFPPQERQHSSEQPRPTPSPSRDASVPISDRAELIERLKRGESPTWVPHRRLESLIHLQSPHSPTQNSRSASADTTAGSLLPAADIAPQKSSLDVPSQEDETSRRLHDGLNIERPRSALHSGDFTHTSLETPPHRTGSRDADNGNRGHIEGLAGRRPFHSESASWLATSPPRHYTPFSFATTTPRKSSLAEVDAFRTTPSSLSSSISSSFVFKPPTSPLVQSQSNDDDTTDITVPMNNIDIVGSPSVGSWRTSPRRHTLNSGSYTPLHHSQSSPYAALFPPAPPLLPQDMPGAHRRESVIPYQAHQPRRSLNSTPNFHYPFTTSMPQTPLSSSYSRRPSFTDSSPLQHASMVGSYEESILRGRMSTTPSKPLDFLAQIGVLGLGPKCKPSLRCPPHVTLPFSAVFYSYASTLHGRSTESEDGPSPYVGMIDLENGLPNTEADLRSNRKRLKSRTRAASNARPLPSGQEERTRGGPEDATASGDLQGEDAVMNDAPGGMSDPDTLGTSTAVPRPHKRRSNGVRAPPGGSYRIPAHGQLQIIIKNQNKTAVKLFLIPYDLTDMEPGTKTFIRQRSYSAGPIIDNIPALSEKSLSERPILRYLIHLHICSPSRGRYYLYKSIRVVFANRVPDGKEKLRNELTFPEPRYSPYKPMRAMHPVNSSIAVSGGGPGAALAAEKAYRRRSAGLYISSHHSRNMAELDQLSPPMPVPVPMSIPMPPPSATWRSSHQSPYADFNFADSNMPVDPVPFGLVHSPLQSETSPLTDHPSSDDAKVGSAAPSTAKDSSGQGRDSPGAVHEPLSYNKLNKGDVGYGGNAFVPMVNGSPVATEGLLSQRLRSLEMQKPKQEGEEVQDERSRP